MDSLNRMLTDIREANLLVLEGAPPEQVDRVPMSLECHWSDRHG